MSSIDILAADKDEAERLNAQYTWCKECCWDGKSQLFAPVDLQKPNLTVLDAGCGTGTYMTCEYSYLSDSTLLPGVWTIDIAKEASAQTTFFAVDYNLSTFRHSNSELPNNVHPLQLDLFTDFVAEQEWYDKFDLINQRLMVVAFRKDQWEKVLKSHQKALRPGAYLQLYEFDMVNSTCGTEVAYVRQWMFNSAARNGMVIDVVEFVPELLAKVGFTQIQQINNETPIVDGGSDDDSVNTKRQLGISAWYKLGAYVYKKLEEAKAISSEERTERLKRLDAELRNSSSKSVLKSVVWVARTPVDAAASG
ncbi:hypothetical protein EMMF5_001846 [Cystobasidiomycetes sp. EMM_F5]